MAAVRYKFEVEGRVVYTAYSERKSEAAMVALIKEQFNYIIEPNEVEWKIFKIDDGIKKEASYEAEKDFEQDLR